MNVSSMLSKLKNDEMYFFFLSFFFLDYIVSCIMRSVSFKLVIFKYYL